MSGSRFPWEEAMSLGLGTLHMPPEIFWRMTLPELAAAARAMRPDVRNMMGRDELAEMMRRFPDDQDVDGLDEPGHDGEKRFHR